MPPLWWRQLTPLSNTSLSLYIYIYISFIFFADNIQPLSAYLKHVNFINDDFDSIIDMDPNISTSLPLTDPSRPSGGTSLKRFRYRTVLHQSTIEYCMDWGKEIKDEIDEVRMDTNNAHHSNDMNPSLIDGIAISIRIHF